MTETVNRRVQSFQYEVLPGLAPLAWLLIEKGDGMVIVRHGAKVETRSNFFVEGVWDGEFDSGEFHLCEAFFGSGVRLMADGLVLVPSGTTNDFCYYCIRGSCFYASNSLALLLAELGDELAPRETDYIAINNSILLGIEKFTSSLPTRNGTIERLMHKNLWLHDGKVELRSKPSPTPFLNFEGYLRHLDSCFERVSRNARDSSRQHCMSLASTQSRGYDSTAINAIAAKYGLDQVFTIAQAKTHGRFADQESKDNSDDSGDEIGKVLGFSCTTIDRRSIYKQPELEYLYYASLHASEDTSLAGINSLVKSPSILLLGCLGEITAPYRYYHNYYGRSEESIADCERADHGCNGLGEVRLQFGFITLPLFYIGARQRRSILDICDSQEMDPWRLNNNYDRPVARRIAEGAGVPRELFGQKKNATAMVFTPPINPVDPVLRHEYREYLASSGVLARWKWLLLPLVHWINGIIWFTSPRQHRWLYYLQRLVARLRGKEFHFKTRWRHLDNFFFAYCVNKRSLEYRRWLGREQA